MLTLSGLAAEAYLRHFRPVHGVLYRLHPRYLHTLVPGARRLFTHQPEDGGGSLLVRVNRDGFIGPELTRRRDQGRRVVVYGDSFVAGEFSPWKERFATLLARRLSEPGRPTVEAVNAGVVGYGPDQEALRLEDEIGSLKPDLVVVAVFAGTTRDLLRDRSSPSTRRDAWCPAAPGSGKPSAPVRPRRSGGSGRHAPPRPARLATYAGRGPARFAPTRGRSFPYLLQRRQREFQLSTHDQTHTVEHLLRDPYDADVSLTPEAESSRYKTALMAQVLGRMAQTAQLHATPLVFVFIPSAFEVGEGFEHPDPSAFPSAPAARRPDALARPARAQGLLYVDLGPVFRGALPQHLYFRRDEHWNAPGQALAAETVAAFVRAEGLLK